jgi:tetratricopeptide (TPR) repeat protein
MSVNSCIKTFCVLAAILTAVISGGCGRHRAVELYVDAVMLNDLDQHTKALKKLDVALINDRSFALAYSLKGDIYQKQGNYEQSSKAYEKATELNPMSFKDFYNLGVVNVHLERLRKAANAFVAASQIDPDNYDAHFQAGLCYQKLQDYGNAIPCYNNARQIKPDSTEIDRMLGEIFTELEDYDKAVSEYRRALEREGNKPELMMPLAAAYLRLERYRAAEELLNAVVNMEPANKMAYQYLGYAVIKTGNPQAAVGHYLKAVDLDYTDWMSHKGLGVAYLLSYGETGQRDTLRKGIDQWEIALKMNPDQPQLIRMINKYKPMLSN